MIRIYWYTYIYIYIYMHVCMYGSVLGGAPPTYGTPPCGVGGGGGAGGGSTSSI